MQKTLAYTFRMFPYKDELPFKKVSVFGKLNNDIKNFCNEILTTKPDRIVGFAESMEKFSTVERYAINQFNQHKRILSVAPDIYELNVPVELTKLFQVRTTPTTSFCNLSMLKIMHFLKENNLNIPFTFIHVSQNDLKKCQNIFN